MNFIKRLFKHECCEHNKETQRLRDSVREIYHDIAKTLNGFEMRLNKIDKNKIILTEPVNIFNSEVESSNYCNAFQHLSNDKSFSEGGILKCVLIEFQKHYAGKDLEPGTYEFRLMINKLKNRDKSAEAENG